VRQGEATPKSGWIGNASGGVKAPEPILLPDAAVRFARTAERLEGLSKGHPMEGWLDFIAKVARAQHHIATMLPPFAAPDQAAVEQAVAARIPPISADGHRRDPAWRDGLALLLDTAVGEGLSSPAATVAAELRARTAASTDTQADAFLRGVVDEADAGFSFWIAAALQVYFTRLAGRLCSGPCVPAAALPLRLASSPPRSKIPGRAISTAPSARLAGTIRARSASPAAARARSRSGESKAIPAL
jgi:FdhE protein